MKLARFPVRCLERTDWYTLTIGARNPPIARHHAEHLSDSRLMFTDDLARMKVHEHGSCRVIHSHDRREHEVAVELGDVMPSVAIKGNDLHKSSVATTGPGARGSDKMLGMSDSSSGRLRIADLADEPAIATLMQSSIRHFFPMYYSPPQVEASLLYVGVPDRDLIADGTYFVAGDDAGLIACGGWSMRDKLYAGSDDAGDSRLLDPKTEAAHIRAMFVRPDCSRRGLGRSIIEASEVAASAAGFTEMTLMATLPGEPLYVACGFREVERTDVLAPNGTLLPCVAMNKSLG